MAKTYLNIAKYLIKTKFEIKGIVDKHDIIGAVFGQSEGLIGESMDLRELQNNGKIGRIEVNSKTQSGITTGVLTIPSSMDMVQTSILAAAIETVDKVGPCESKFETISIEDLRAAKREQITARAQELLSKLAQKIPESQELAEEIRSKTKVAELQEFGKDKLPCGPDVVTENEIIVVEGRADVLNLLKHGVKNAIGMNGSNISKDLIKLCENKEVTAFIDGDRGGLLNLKKLQNLAKVDFVVKAPDGKEVEELTKKEIVTSMRKKIPVDEFVSVQRKTFIRRFKEPKGLRKKCVQYRPRSSKGYSPKASEKAESIPLTKKTSKDALIGSPEELKKFQPVMQELQNSLKGRLLDKNGKIIAEVSVRKLLGLMSKKKNVNAVVFDGIITKRMVEEAERNGIKYVVGIKKGRVEDSKKVKIVVIP